MSQAKDILPDEVVWHYAQQQDEDQRLRRGTGRLERLRTEAICAAHLPSAPAEVLDVGGGTGPYARWLARRGYRVHLIDALAHHVEAAKRASAAQPQAALASAAVGDARALDRNDASVDAVLLLGPLYHLTRRDERVRALAEACRVLRPGGVVLAAAITRFVSTVGGLFDGKVFNDAFAAIARRDRAKGQHRNPARHPAYFTTAYFHHPRELGEEVEAAGLAHQATLSVEGVGAWLPELDATLDDPARREALLGLLTELEGEPTLWGSGPHLIAVGCKEAGPRNAAGPRHS